MKLILGTAEFGEAYGREVTAPPTLDELKALLELARQANIDTLDTATAYKCSHILKDHATDFKIVTKVRYPYNLKQVMADLGRTRLEGLLYHHTINEVPTVLFNDEAVNFSGASLYFPHQYRPEYRLVQIPLSPSWPHFLPYLPMIKAKIHVRSIFGAGELLKYYSIKNCIDFVKSMAQYIDGVVVGCNKAQELEEILKYW